MLSEEDIEHIANIKSEQIRGRIARGECLDDFHDGYDAGYRDAMLHVLEKYTVEERDFKK